MGHAMFNVVWGFGPHHTKSRRAGDDSSRISLIPRTHIKNKVPRVVSPASLLHSVAVNKAGPRASESCLIHKLQANKKHKKYLKSIKKTRQMALKVSSGFHTPTPPPHTHISKPHSMHTHAKSKRKPKTKSGNSRGACIHEGCWHMDTNGRIRK